jgi:exo-1,4-beta-D-glucosaminidase
VRLDNPGDRIAFFIELGLVAESTGRSIVPVFWDDNYLSLLPGESRRVEASIDSAEETPRLTVGGWNVRVAEEGTL